MRCCVSVYLVSFLTTALAVDREFRFNLTLEDDLSDCLQKNSARIIGAKNATVGAFPYQASLRDKNQRHFCGGSIMSERWILTAAHCLLDHEAGDILIIVGSNKLDSGGVTYQSVKLVVHQNFSLINELHDIGLVRVNETIKFNDLVKPIELSQDEDWTNYPAVVSGWGYSQRGGRLSNDLQYIITCLPDQKECTEKIAVVNMWQKICTINRSGQGICQGDSGGPLVVNGKQIGLVSYHVVMCAFGFPDFYTRVSCYSDWISENLSAI